VSGDIFLVRGEDELLPTTETADDTEDVLQALIARFLLAGDQLPGDEPRRCSVGNASGEWLVVEEQAALLTRPGRLHMEDRHFWTRSGRRLAS
jgi:hypothetical protein